MIWLPRPEQRETETMLLPSCSLFKYNLSGVPCKIQLALKNVVKQNNLGSRWVRCWQCKMVLAIGFLLSATRILEHRRLHSVDAMQMRRPRAACTTASVLASKVYAAIVSRQQHGLGRYTHELGRCQRACARFLVELLSGNPPSRPPWQRFHTAVRAQARPYPQLDAGTVCAPSNVFSIGCMMGTHFCFESSQVGLTACHLAVAAEREGKKTKAKTCPHVASRKSKCGAASLR